MPSYKMRLLRNVNGRGNMGFEFIVTQESQRDNYVEKGMAKCVETIPDAKVAGSPADKMVRKTSTKAAPTVTRKKRPNYPSPGGYGRGVPRRR